MWVNEHCWLLSSFIGLKRPHASLPMVQPDGMTVACLYMIHLLPSGGLTGDASKLLIRLCFKNVGFRH